MKDKIVGLGEALWDVLPEGKKIGGAPANFAYHAGRFGFQGVAASAVGNDDLGEETIKALQEKGLECILPRVDFPTGTVGVTLDEAGVPTYDIKTGSAWDNVPYTEALDQVARTCRAVCWGSLAQRNEVTRRTIYRFLDTMPFDNDHLRIFDINLRQDFYNAEIIDESIKRCNILKINDEELVIVGKLFGFSEMDADSGCKHLLEKYNLNILILTCGTNGSYVFTHDKTSFMPTPKVAAIDTVGAGDSFSGSFCAEILQGKTIEEAHKTAVNVSAFVCTQPGAMPDYSPSTVLPNE